MEQSLSLNSYLFLACSGNSPTQQDRLFIPTTYRLLWKYCVWLVCRLCLTGGQIVSDRCADCVWLVCRLCLTGGQIVSDRCADCVWLVCTLSNCCADCVWPVCRLSDWCAHCLTVVQIVSDRCADCVWLVCTLSNCCADCVWPVCRLCLTGVQIVEDYLTSQNTPHFLCKLNKI